MLKHFKQYKVLLYLAINITILSIFYIAYNKGKNIIKLIIINKIF